MVTLDPGGTVEGGSDSAADPASGEIRVRLEEVDGFFIEGFEVGLRFEDGDGQLLAATLWSDFVVSTGNTDLDSFYDSVLSQPVPAGPVHVSAEVNIGAGPAPSVPDLIAELPCALTVEVDPGAVVVLEASFDASDDCLRAVPPDGGAADSANALSEPATAEAPTTAAPGVEPGPDEPLSLDVGTVHHVDVDLDCQAFELGGIWVLVDGDTSTWQPPGERHEGGTFTIDRPGHGRFVGDAFGEKTATFRLLGPTERPGCNPVPRGVR